MTFLTLLVLAILIVGLVAVASLRRIAQEAALRRAEHYPVYSAAQIAAQTAQCRKYRLEAEECTERCREKWGGKTTTTSEESSAYLHDKFAAAYEEGRHEREVRHLSMMIQANARVRRGDELLADARSRVWNDYSDGIQTDLMDYVKAQKEAGVWKSWR